MAGRDERMAGGAGSEGGGMTAEERRDRWVAEMFAASQELSYLCIEAERDERMETIPSRLDVLGATLGNLRAEAFRLKRELGR